MTYFFVKNEEMLFEPRAAFSNDFSLADTLRSGNITTGFVSIWNVRSSCDLTRFNALCSSPPSDFRFNGFNFSKPKWADSFSTKHLGIYSHRIPKAYANSSPCTENIERKKCTIFLVARKYNAKYRPYHFEPLDYRTSRTWQNKLTLHQYESFSPAIHPKAFYISVLTTSMPSIRHIERLLAIYLLFDWQSEIAKLLNNIVARNHCGVLTMDNSSVDIKSSSKCVSGNLSSTIAWSNGTHRVELFSCK